MSLNTFLLLESMISLELNGHRKSVYWLRCTFPWTSVRCQKMLGRGRASFAHGLPYQLYCEYWMCACWEEILNRRALYGRWLWSHRCPWKQNCYLRTDCWAPAAQICLTKGLNETSIGCRLFDTLADRISHDISKIPSAYRLSMRGKQNTSRLFLQEKAQDILRVDAKSVCRLLWL